MKEPDYRHAAYCIGYSDSCDELPINTGLAEKYPTYLDGYHNGEKDSKELKKALDS